jgi:peptide/nickel transport system ATP-binding protein
MRPVSHSDTPLLSVQSLRAIHRSRDGSVVAADDVTFTVAKGECVALVGESGSGKTTIARCVVGLHAPAAGTILLNGQRLEPSARQRSRDSRRRCQIVFQNPYDSLNPRHRVSYTIGRTARVLRGLTERQVEQEVTRLLELVRLPGAVAERFPAELSGGERQRVAIARALAAGPSLLVCDEITSALDVSVQAAVLELLETLISGSDLSLLVISHDLGVVASIADRMLILERGLICEEGEPGPLLQKPTHSYTRQLVDAAPRLARDSTGESNLHGRSA